MNVDEVHEVPSKLAPPPEPKNIGGLSSRLLSRRKGQGGMVTKHIREYRNKRNKRNKLSKMSRRQNRKG